MVDAGRIVERAAQRARQRSRQFGPTGAWSDSPVDLVRDAAQRWPDHPAVADRLHELSYAELDRAVSAGAAALRAGGLAFGDPMLVVVRNDLDSVVAIHAGLRAGAVVLVAPVTAGRAQLAHVIEHAAPTVSLAPASAVGTDHLPTGGPGWWSLTGLADGDADFEPAGNERSADDPSIVIYTSGTTSRPKGVIHSMSTLLVASRNYIDAAELDGGDRLFVVSPLASITGLLQCITVPPLLGALVVLETKWNPAATCELLLQRGGTFFGGPDLVLDRLLDEVEARGETSTSLEAVYLGGAMLDPRILDRIENDFGIVVLRAYGSSEAPISTAGRRSERRAVRLADDGAPLAGVDVRRGSTNDPAECCLAGPHLFLGYVDREDDAHAFETDDAGRDWFCTGDVADLEDGRLRVVGRIRDVVIRKGLKVPISEVEGYASSLPGIARSAGYAVADPETGERLALAILPDDGGVIDFNAVVDGLRSAGLATWKLPEEIVVWDEPFPENATGKVLRDRVAEMAAGRPRMVADRLQEGHA